MFNRTAFLTSLFPVVMLVCSNIFSSNICEAGGNALESKGRGAVLSLHCAGVSFQKCVALSCSHANHCRIGISGNRVRSKPSASEIRIT